MKYETPELTALATAINAVQGSIGKQFPSSPDNHVLDEGVGAYADWEE